MDKVVKTTKAKKKVESGWPTNRGDSRTRRTREAKLVRSIIASFGGPAKFAKKVTELSFGKIAVSADNAMNWSYRGAVPLERCLTIAKLLDVSPFALNYIDMCKMSIDRPSWEEVVRECKELSPRIITDLVRLKK